MSSGSSKGECMLRVTGLVPSRLLLGLFLALVPLTGGVLAVVCWWVPALFYRLTCLSCPLSEARFLFVWRRIGQRVPDVAHVEVDSGIRSTAYRCFRYVFSESSGSFERVAYQGQTFDEIHRLASAEGQATRDLAKTKGIFGENLIDIPIMPILQLFLGEVFHPFFLFQLFSFGVWASEDYYYYATIVLVMSMVSAGVDMYSVRSTSMKLRSMATFVCPAIRVNVARGVDEQVSSAELLPGDVVTLEGLQTLPCDIVLLSGHVVANESCLTGECVPVLKTPLPLAADEAGAKYHPDTQAKHTVYAGTTLVCVKRGDSRPVGMVVRTGFETVKGALVQSIVHPPATKLTMEKDALYFVVLLGVLSVAGMSYVLWLYNEYGSSVSDMVLNALDLVTIAVPPALPLALTVGTINAISRLKQRKISTVSPKRVAEAGKLQLMVFDKTGTLTEEGLQVVGVCCPGAVAPSPPLEGKTKEGGDGAGAATQPEARFGEMETEPAKAGAGISEVMACCNSLALLDGQLIGDPLDVVMFAYLGWELTEEVCGAGGGGGVEQEVATYVRPAAGRMEPGDHGAGYKILRRFEFSPALQRQVVLSERAGAGAEVTVTVKGAPEVIRGLCKEETVPADFEEVLSRYTTSGYRVIACGSRGSGRKEAGGVTREEAEKGLDFQGLIVFENRLKAATIPAVAELTGARIRSVMATGDQLQTAVAVARRCGIVRTERVYLGTGLREGRPVWVAEQPGAAALDPDTLLPSDGSKEFELAVSGAVFQWYKGGVAAGAGPTASGVSGVDMLTRLLVCCQVYARMKPDDKRELIEACEAAGYLTGMCGDGANDCGALKAARVGLSLAQTEASIAAPFTSTITDISSVLTLLKEGRCALSTSLSLFRYMSVYSLSQFVATIILYYTYCYFGDFLWLYQDLFITTFFCFTMSRTAACKKLSKRRPTSSLLTPYIIASILGEIAIQVATLAVVYTIATQQSWYVTPNNGDGETFLSTHSTFVVFITTDFTLVTIAIVFSVGKPFRKSMVRNWWMMCSILGLTALNIFTLFNPDKAYYTWLELPTGTNPTSSEADTSSGEQFFNGDNPPPVPYSFRWVILGCVAACFAASILWETLISTWIPRMFGNTRVYRKKRAAYAVVEREILGVPPGMRKKDFIRPILSKTVQDPLEVLAVVNV